MFATILVTTCTALSASAVAQEPNGKKAYFDTGEGLDFEFRSFAAGFLTNLMLELDFYFNEKWVGGVNGTFDVELDEEACIGACREESRFTLFGERIWGGRWGHVGVRAGPYYGHLYHNFFNRYGTELAHVGPIFGLNIGASATVTPVRWAGVTLTASVFPGLFVGQQSTPHCWSCFNEENARPAQSFELSGMVAILVRLGDLDGPERECSQCGPAPSNPPPSEPESEPESESDTELEHTFLPGGRD